MALLRRDDEWCPAVRGDRLVHISATLQERIDQVHMALARSDEEGHLAVVTKPIAAGCTPLYMAAQEGHLAVV